MAKNKVYVKINGSEYTMIGEEPEDYLFLISRYLDKKIKETLAANPKHSNTSAAVLTALTITDELYQVRKENEELKTIVREPEDKLTSVSNECEEVKAAYISVCNEFESFKQQNETDKEDIDELKKVYNELYENYIKKNEEYETLLNETNQLQEHASNLEKENADINLRLRELKDELLESEIENVKVNKEFKDFKGSYGKRNNIL